MPKQYLEIDSSYRDRNLYPNPASFMIQTNLYNTKTTSLNAVDPVCDDVLLVSWRLNNFSDYPFILPSSGIFLQSAEGEIFDFITNDIIELGFSGNNVLVLKDINFGGVLHLTSNYYYGATIHIDDQSSPILAYEYLGNNRCIVKTKTTLAVSNESIIVISDPTGGFTFENYYFSKKSLYIFVPNGPYNSTFVDFLLYNRTTDEYYNINQPIASNNIILIQQDATQPFGFFDQLEIRGKKPKAINKEMEYLDTTAIIANISSLSFPFKDELDISNFKVGDFIELSGSMLISGLAIIDENGGENNQVRLDLGASVTHDAYVGATIRLFMNIIGESITSEDRTIISYNGITRTVTVSSGYNNNIVLGAYHLYKIYLPIQSKRITKIVDESFTVSDIDIDGNTISIINNSNASIESGFYKDFYIKRLGQPDIYGYITDHSVIKTSIVLTNTLTVAWTAPPAIDVENELYIHSCKINPSFDRAILLKYDTIVTLEGVQHTDNVNSVSFNLDKSRIVSGSNDGTIKIWNAITGDLIHTITLALQVVNSVAFNPDGSQIVAGSGDGTINTWDAITGVFIQTLVGHIASVNSVSFNPEGSRIVSGSDDGFIKIWDAVTGGLIYDFATLGPVISVNSVAFNPDGSQIVAGSGDGTINTWDAITGDFIQTLVGHIASVNSVAFNPQGSRIVSGSDDGTIKIWDANFPRDLIQTIEVSNPLSPVTSVGFNADTLGRPLIVSGSYDGFIKIWKQMIDPILFFETPEEYEIAFEYNYELPVLSVALDLGNLYPQQKVVFGGVTSPVTSPVNLWYFDKPKDSFSVLGFSRDNRVFLKGGTDHTRTEIDEFEITLVNLTLPNRPLKCSKGGYITEYPYVYVRFSNPAVFKPNYFLSNSPHTEGVTFRVPITNFVDDQTTDFVTLVAGNMTYTTVFTFSEDIEFQVTLPDGSIFETIDSDLFSPSGPNANLQISAFFEIKKILCSI